MDAMKVKAYEDMSSYISSNSSNDDSSSSGIIPNVTNMASEGTPAAATGTHNAASHAEHTNIFFRSCTSKCSIPWISQSPKWLRFLIVGSAISTIFSIVFLITVSGINNKSSANKEPISSLAPNEDSNNAQLDSEVSITGRWDGGLMVPSDQPSIIFDLVPPNPSESLSDEVTLPSEVQPETEYEKETTPPTITISNPPTTPQVTNNPTQDPTPNPTGQPTIFLSSIPSPSPTLSPTTTHPTKTATSSPTDFFGKMTFLPLLFPTPSPITTLPPTIIHPTANPSLIPTITITKSPSFFPTTSPTEKSSLSPTEIMSQSPSHLPTLSPTTYPTTTHPTKMSSQSPTGVPSKSPSSHPTLSPTAHPIARVISNDISNDTTGVPSKSPSSHPTLSPTTYPATTHPTKEPSPSPSDIPSKLASIIPTTTHPTKEPSPTSSSSTAELPPTTLPTSSSLTTAFPTIETTTSNAVTDLIMTPPPVATSTFYITGSRSNISENKSQESLIKEISKMNDNKADFFVHLGDFNTDTRCDETSYETFSRFLKKTSKVPVFLLLGDNEWNNCPDPDKAWSYWTKYFDRLEANWSHDMMILREAAYRDVFSFLDKEVLYIGVRMLGGGHITVDEWDNLILSNTWWVQLQLAIYQYQFKALVIFAHDNMNENHNHDFYSALSTDVDALQIPTLYLYVTENQFSITKVNTDDDDDVMTPEFKVVSIKGGNVPFTKIEIDATKDDPFAFENVEI